MDFVPGGDLFFEKNNQLKNLKNVLFYSFVLYACVSLYFFLTLPVPDELSLHKKTQNTNTRLLARSLQI